MLKFISLCLAAIVVALLAAHVAFRPPSLEDRTVSRAAEAAATTALGGVMLTPPEQRGGDSGVVPLIDGTDAFAARIALIRAAEMALDVQYYIWQCTGARY